MRRFFLTGVALVCCECGCVPTTSPAPVEPAIHIVDTVLVGDRVTSRFVGKPTALFFWSSWCKVCIEELPRIQRLARAVNDVGVQVRAVAMIDDAASAECAMNTAQFNVPVVLDTEGAIGKALGVSGLPAMVLLDQDGKPHPMLDPEDGTMRTLINGPRKWDDPSVVMYLQSMSTRRQ